MKKLFTLLTILMCLFTGAHAQGAEGGDFYLDLVTLNNAKYYFTQRPDGIYEVTVPQLSGDFKVFDSRYLTDPKNEYIYGAADDHSFGVDVGDIKYLANPGNNLSVEGGGIIYNAVVEFDPVNKTLKITAGSRDPEDAPITTAMPLLIGQFKDAEGTMVNWDPSQVITPVYYEKDDIYIFPDVCFTNNGEFSFITKKGTNSSDWSTVNSSVRYAPADAEKDVEMSTWMPYSEFYNGTSNKWIFPTEYRKYLTGLTNFAVYLGPKTKEVYIQFIMVTGVKNIEAIEVTDKPVDVYSLTGTLLKHGVNRTSATDGLPSGLYIVGGKKVIVR